MKKKKLTMWAALLLFFAAGVYYLLIFGKGSGTDKGLFRFSFGNSKEDVFVLDPEVGHQESERTTAEAERVTVWVHVCGQVIMPGVYELAEGTRVVEAIEAAGGLTEKAAGEWLNQALPVTDGQRIYVPSKEEAEAAGDISGILSGTAFAGTSGDSSDAEKGAYGEGRVNLNTADKELLMSLPGIGSARAEAIIESRQRDGPFETVEDIQRISGISGVVYEKLKDRVTVN